MYLRTVSELTLALLSSVVRLLMSPTTEAPAVLTKYELVQRARKYLTLGNSARIMREVYPLSRNAISQGANLGSELTNRCTWSDCIPKGSNSQERLFPNPVLGIFDAKGLATVLLPCQPTLF